MATTLLHLQSHLIMNHARAVASSLARRVIQKSMPMKNTLIPCAVSARCRRVIARRHFSDEPYDQLDMQPRRRRRRPGSEDSGNSDGYRRSGSPIGVTDPLAFADAAQNFLDKIELSLIPMERVNDVFIINRTPLKLTLTLAPHHGQYVFEINEEQTAIRFVSPMSGGYSYLCNAMTGEWECQQDGHRLVGMFVRDLVCQVNGLPEL